MTAAKTFLTHRPTSTPPLRWHRPPVHAQPTSRSCAARSRSSTRSPSSAPALWELLHTSPTCTRARRADRQPGGADGARGPEGHLPLGLAGRRRRQHRRPDVPRPEPLPGRLGARTCVKRINQALLRADQIEHAEGKAQARLVRADHRRRRGRLRRPAQRLRADEGDDRGGRRRRSLRGPARQREEVRPHGRQGAGADEPVHPHARRGPPRGRRDGRAHAGRRAHRRRQREAAHQRRRRARQAVHHGRAHGRGLLRIEGRPRHAIARGLAYAPYADLVWCETSTPDLARPSSSPRASTPSSRQAARLQLLALVQLEEEPRRRDHRQVPARARGHGLQVPVRHAGGLPRAQPRRCSSSPAYKRARHGGLLRSCSSRVRAEKHGYTATKHQREVGTGYFDARSPR
jgi:isocitrate lyase